MSADTLTDAQARGLSIVRLAEERGLTCFDGSNGKSRMRADGVYLNQSTWGSLERRGLVQVDRPTIANWTIEFTSAGREALAAHEARHEAGDRRG